MMLASQTISTADAFDPAPYHQTLFASLLDAAKREGGNREVLEDAENPALTYGRLVLGSLILGKKITRDTAPGETVAVLLPNTNAMVVTLFALNAYGRPAALLNFTAGSQNNISALNTAEVRTIITSRRFIAMGELEPLRDALAAAPMADGTSRRIIYLEDVRQSIGTMDKLSGLVSKARAKKLHERSGMHPDDPAVILFTSGTEAAPKAVVLSNTNIVANAGQIFQHADGMLTAQDVVFNPLPIFHSFGLTAGTLMPILNGLRVVLYPSPLHYKQIPKLVAERKATVLFATDTFLQGYARSAGEGDLDGLRHVVAGAERVRDSTRRLWASTGANLLEGYGATECAPVLSCNLPQRNTPGSVGPLLPGLEAKLEEVPGISDGGRLYIRGPNVMLGYMTAERPGELAQTNDGWHDTGDIVEIDEHKRVAIKGRAKRFAKIGGEMVSLAAVETLASHVWPDNCHVALNIPDQTKGEQIVLLTDTADADRSQLLHEAREQGISELWLPRRIVHVAEIPLLGSGKVDFPGARRLFDEVLAKAA